MIVDPDFFDHWRTRMVADALQDSMAPVYIMRLWGHCQNRKGDVFDIPAAGIKALCQFAGDAQALEDALISAEYMERDGLTITVTGWAEKNSALLAAWENGHKGGRPRKNPAPTKTEPTENPAETHGLPMANPSLTQTKPIRVDKSREEEEKEEEKKPRIRAAATTSLDGVPENMLADFIAVRKAKRAGPLTGTAIAGLKREAAKAGLTLEQAVRACIEFGWQGFNAGWYADRNKTTLAKNAAIDPCPQWCAEAGFEHIAEAENARCHIGNYRDYRNGKRVAHGVAA